MMQYGISVALFPTLWEMGYAKVRRKHVVAIGPFRFSLHAVQGSLSDYAGN